MDARTGRFALVEQLLAAGVTHVFGNPGTTEQGLLDAFEAFPRLSYIMSLQESVAVAMADGFARASKRPAVVLLHNGVGLGNGIGMMYQALRGHAPLVVLAGESGLRYDGMDAQMAADLVTMARPVTKYATRVLDAGSLLRILRRAIKIAATPPMGPVFVCLPADVLDAANSEPVAPVVDLDTRSMPARSELARAARLLLDARAPLCIVGDGVAFSHAQAELARVAELLGAKVWGADSSEVNLAFDHPLFQGMLGHMFGSDSHAAVASADAVLIVGTYVFPEVYPFLEGAFAPGTRIVHIDLNGYEIAKNFPVDIGFVADPRSTLAGLGEVLAELQTRADQLAAADRIAASAAAQESTRKESLERDRAAASAVPLPMSRFTAALAAKLPPDFILFDEALTASADVTRYLRPTLPDHFFQTRGGSLGVGIPGALGIKLARPDKTVLCFTGDGGSMYTIQALWTAARYGIGAKLVICNNHRYRLLADNILQYWRDQVQVPQHAFPSSFDLSPPVIDFSVLAQSLGVDAMRVSRPEEIDFAVARMLSDDRPFLVDVVVASDSSAEKR